jgi:hypothetical protein
MPWQWLEWLSWLPKGRVDHVRFTYWPQPILQLGSLSLHRLGNPGVADLGVNDELHERAAIVVLDETLPGASAECDRLCETLDIQSHTQ